MNTNGKKPHALHFFICRLFKQKDALIPLLIDTDAGIRGQAIRCLDRIDPNWPKSVEARECVPELITALGDENPNPVRAAAAKTLGLIGDKRATDALLCLLNDPKSGSAKIQAAEALSAMMPETVVRSLVSVLKDNNEELRMAEIKAMETSTVQHENARIRAEAIRAMGKIGDKRFVDTLIAELKSGHPEIRAAAAEALGMIGDERAVEGLIAAFVDRHTYKASAIALGRIGDERAIDPLASVINDGDPRVRLVAAQALGKIRSELAVNPLLFALNDFDFDVRVAAAGALGELGDSRAVNPLVQALRYNPSDKQVRNALKEIIDSNLPFVSHYPDLFCYRCNSRITQIRRIGVWSVFAQLVSCSSCHGTLYFHTGIKRVDGEIGGDTQDMGKQNETLRFALWNEKDKTVRRAQIDRIVIREGGVRNYHMAVNAVMIEFSSDSKPPVQLRKIPVCIVGNPPLTNGTVNMLKDNFRTVSRSQNGEFPK